MIVSNIYNKTKVYVACPYGIISGGPESLHQLVFELNNLGFDAYIYYYNTKHKVEISERYRKYVNKVVYHIQDCYYNIIIIPETCTELLYKYKYIKKYIWWLSVDFYFKTSPNEVSKNNKFINKIKNPKMGKMIYYIIKIVYIIRTKKYKILDFENDVNIESYVHLYNCKYVEEFLISKGIKREKMNYLCGPINNEYILGKNIIAMKKHNIVTYNPAKEKEFYEKFIEYVYKKRKDIIFLPIKNMNQEEVVILLRKSKVYMDFGFFPGPERMPREAVVSYCNILTSNRGSAKNNEDILIPKKYKYDIENCDIDEIYHGLIELIDNYEENLQLYDLYREKVFNQIERFDKDIFNIFIKK